MLRWFWWRINAWSEITAMVASLVAFIVVSRWIESNEYRLAVVAGITVVAWLAVTFLTRPERPEALDRFYRKVRPAGPGWQSVAARHPDVRRDDRLGLSILAAVFAAGIVYCTLPAIGLLLFGDLARGAAALLAAAACAGGVVVTARRMGWERIAG
jgi:cytochrome c biogenesis protein CcdA